MSSKKIFIVSLLMTIVVGFFVVANLAQAADDYGLSATAGAAGLTKTMSSDLPIVVGNLLGTALSFIGVLFFALMVFGGFMWMTARGNEEQTKKALNTITAAVIGLVIVLSSYTITSFVFKSAGVTSGGSSSGGTTDDTNANAACVDFNPSFTCTNIVNCEGIKEADGTDMVEAAQNALDNTTAKAACTRSGDESCKTGLCSGNNTVVCCKAKTETVNWCYVNADKVCKTQIALGSATCNATMTGNDKYWNEAGTEASCYTKALVNGSCTSDSDCKSDMTGLVCSATGKFCVEKSLSGTCTRNNDCAEGYVCHIQSGSAQGLCAKGTSCPSGSQVFTAGSFDNCSWSACDGAGDICETDNQCASTHCVADKDGVKHCQEGNTCSVCRKDSDCEDGYFCDLSGRTTALFDTGCHEKIAKGGDCYDVANACAGGMQCLNGKCQ